jgi:hypothetical protein
VGAYLEEKMATIAGIKKITKAQAKRRLDEIAGLINQLHVLGEISFGKGTYIYFEAEGSAYLMREEAPNDAELTASQRQEKIIASSKTCLFDCGAW